VPNSYHLPVLVRPQIPLRNADEDCQIRAERLIDEFCADVRGVPNESGTQSGAPRLKQVEWNPAMK